MKSLGKKLFFLIFCGLIVISYSSAAYPQIATGNEKALATTALTPLPIEEVSALTPLPIEEVSEAKSLPAITTTTDTLTTADAVVDSMTDLTAAANVVPWPHWWYKNEYLRNNTRQTAYDAVKILRGWWPIWGMRSNIFQQRMWWWVIDMFGRRWTVLKWRGGALPPGGSAYLCFWAFGWRPPQVAAFWWTDKRQWPIIPPYYPPADYTNNAALSVEVNFTDTGDNRFAPVITLGNFQMTNIKIDENNPEFWEDGGFELGGETGSINIVSAKAAIVDKKFTADTLNLENTINSRELGKYFMDVKIPASTIQYGQAIPLPPLTTADGAPLTMAPGQSLVIVVELASGDYELVSVETPIPSKCGETDMGMLDIQDTEQHLGGVVSIPIRIQGAANQVFSAGFDLTYDPGVLSYLTFTKGPLSNKFKMLEVARVEPGRLRIGWVDTVGSIVPGESGDVIYLQFQVIGGVENQSYPLKLDALRDDISDWLASGGCLTVSSCNGDLNGDGSITPTDALIAMRCYLGSGDCPICTDVNSDGVVTPRDALCILEKYLGIPSCLDQREPVAAY